jgi:tRNA-dihydrouridine synthase A
MPLAPISIRFSVAPMMDRTDRHCRFLHRLMSRRTRLYTEMVVVQALHHGRDPARWLAFDPAEHPVAFQIGGAEPALLADAARRVATAGYDEINLNVGCPSDRVSAGRFGACLMAEPRLVATCVGAMKSASAIAVTVKTRIGIDDDTGDGRLDDLVGLAAAAGCDAFFVHARNAILKGLSPKENREIPPLRYDRVYRLKRAFPHLAIAVNGGIASLAATEMHLQHVDGVMVGRAAYERPYEILSAVDHALFGEQSEPPAEDAIALAYLDYAERVVAAQAARPHDVLRHAVNLFRDRPGARRWRQVISGAARDGDAIPNLRRLVGGHRGSEPLAA